MADRAKTEDADASYTARLLQSGLPRIAQKVGEEAVETVIAALAQGPSGSVAGDGSPPTSEVVSESADLLFHLLVLLQAKGITPDRLADELRSRHRTAVGKPEQTVDQSAVGAPRPTEGSRE